MESSPSSRLSFFIEPGKFIASPFEGCECGIAVDVPKSLWHSISLKLGNKSLPLLLSNEDQYAYSQWPACEPGQYKLSLQCGDIRESRMVTVVPLDFGESDLKRLIDELTQLLPKSIVSRLQECGGLAGASTSPGRKPSVEQELFRLRRAITGTADRLGIIQILKIMQHDCYQTLVPRSELRLSTRARRPDISKLNQAISMPNNLSEWGELNRVFDVKVESSFETYENRLVKAYVQALQSQMAELQTRLETEPAPPAVRQEFETLWHDFHLATSRAAFLREVKLPFVSAGRVTMVLLKNPVYRAVLEDYLALYRQATIGLDEPALDSALETFPYLYQVWASLKIMDALLQTAVQAGYRCASHDWVQHDDKGIFVRVLSDGLPAVELAHPATGKLVKLVPWRVSSASSSTRHLSQEPLPAVAAVVFAPGAPPVVLLFDLRYKVSDESAKLSASKDPAEQEMVVKSKRSRTPGAVKRMQANIDELLRCIDQVKTPEGSSEIQYAAILYPGLRMQVNPTLEALPARPGVGDALHQHLCHVFGRYLA